MARRVPLPESKIRRRRNVRRLRLVTFLASFVFVCFGSVVGASWIPQFRIQDVGTTSEVGDVEKILDFTKKEIEGRLLMVFPKDSFLLFPRDEISRKILREFPALAKAELRIQNFKKLDLSLVERDTFAYWCGEHAGSTQGCFRMDEKGLIFAPAMELSQERTYRYMGPATSTPGFTSQELPLQFLSPEYFSQLSSLTGAFAQHQQKQISRVVVDQSLDATLSFENGFSIMFSLRDSGGDIFERFTLALASEPFLNRAISDFEYLDLRFGDKLYYHLKNQ